MSPINVRVGSISLIVMMRVVVNWRKQGLGQTSRK
jgi:hypothetical protein